MIAGCNSNRVIAFGKETEETMLTSYIIVIPTVMVNAFKIALTLIYDNVFLVNLKSK
jgi:hypothetical protein